LVARACLGELPPEPATYVLLLRLKCPVDLTVGKLGRFSFPCGCYAYVGSAHGPGGLAARIARHLRRAKTLHWHIDYLRAHAQPVAVCYYVGEERCECRWARAFATMTGAETPAARFGASDCRCPSHLFHFATTPDLAAFGQAVEERILMETFSD